MSKSRKNKYDVFVSYSRLNREWVFDALMPRLKAAKLKVITDVDFKVGLPSHVNIEQAIKDSRYVLLVLTQSWVKSEWCEFESLLSLNYSPAARNCKLLPIMLTPCKLPKRLAYLTYADFTSPCNFERQIERLIRQINKDNKIVKV